jgi:hypothetical protein
MQGLSGSKLLQVWEAGQRQKPLERAVTILDHVLPYHAHTQLAELPIGRRDELLFNARAATFGSYLRSLVECQNCGEQLEFGFEASDLGIMPETADVELEPVGTLQQFSEDGYTVEFRLLTGLDLETLRREAGPELARSELVHTCIRKVWREGEEITVDRLPDPIIDALAVRLAERDPHALIEFDLECPACGRRWQTTFDIVSFFWAEIEAAARHLLREVHTLARAYGWRETDILALSAARRQAYLEMVVE